MNSAQRRKMRRFTNRLIEGRDITLIQQKMTFPDRLKYLLKPTDNQPGLLIKTKCNFTNDHIKREVLDTRFMPLEDNATGEVSLIKVSGFGPC